MRTVVVIAYNFQDKPLDQPFSMAQIAAYLETVRLFFLRQSGGLLDHSFDIRGWYTIPYNSTDPCDSSKRLPLARQAAIADAVDFSIYEQQIFIAASSTCSSGGGSSTVDGNPSVLHLTGPLSLSTEYRRTHEIGHGLGLYHAYGPSKSTWNYHSVMGYWNLEDITLFAKHRMHWIEPMEILSNGTYDVSAGARIQRDAQSSYYLEYRPMANALSIGLGYLESVDPDSDYQISLVTPGNYFLDGTYLFEFLSSSPPTVRVTFDAITPPPVEISLTLSSDKAVYALREFVTLKAKVLSGSTPRVGVTVAFSINKPDGRIASGSSTTDDLGYAFFRYKLKPHDPVGTWTARVDYAGKYAAVLFEVR